SAVPTCSQPLERIRIVQCSTCRSGLVEESDSTDSITTAKALVVIVGTVRYSGTMRKQVAHNAALLGRRLTLWFAVAWNLMFALWIAAGGLEVKTAYVAHDARMANLPIILTWTAVNFCILIGWYTVSTRTRKAAA